MKASAARAAAAPESGPGPSRPFRGVVHAIPGTIEAEDFDEGGEGVAYPDAEPANLEKRGAPDRVSGVDLERRPAASGGCNLGWTRPGEGLVDTVDVRESGTCRLEFGGEDRTGP